MCEVVRWWSTILGSVAQWERRANGERVKLAIKVDHQEKKARGEVFEPILFEHRRDGKRLRPDAQEQRIIQEIRCMRQAGLGCRAITDRLDCHKRLAKHDGHWFPTRVVRILAREGR